MIRDLPDIRERVTRWAVYLDTMTDSARNRPDYRGRARLTWSTGRYNRGSLDPVAWVVHSARLVRGLSDLLRVIGWNEAQRAALNRAYDVALGSLEEFQEDWVNGASDTGWYVLPTDAPVAGAGFPAPLNMQATAGLAWLRVFEREGWAVAQEHGRRIMRYVHQKVLETRDTTGRWSY